MFSTIQIDRSGRLVLPKTIRERLNLDAGTRLRADVVAGHVELTPVAGDDDPVVIRKSGVKVLKATGAAVDAGAAVAAEREAQETRGLKR